ncbi:hypothetical protein BC443_08960 [Salinicola sp. MIT1003]|nr:hypothetical protein BC443_08960 [Salinicola sp. MIT1003]
MRISAASLVTGSLRRFIVARTTGALPFEPKTVTSQLAHHARLTDTQPFGEHAIGFMLKDGLLANSPIYAGLAFGMIAFVVGSLLTRPHSMVALTP